MTHWASHIINIRRRWHLPWFQSLRLGIFGLCFNLNLFNFLSCFNSFSFNSFSCSQLSSSGSCRCRCYSRCRCRCATANRALCGRRRPPGLVLLPLTAQLLRAALDLLLLPLLLLEQFVPHLKKRNGKQKGNIIGLWSSWHLQWQCSLQFLQSSKGKWTFKPWDGMGYLISGRTHFTLISPRRESPWITTPNWNSPGHLPWFTHPCPPSNCDSHFWALPVAAELDSADQTPWQELLQLVPRNHLKNVVHRTHGRHGVGATIWNQDCNFIPAGGLELHHFSILSRPSNQRKSEFWLAPLDRNFRKLQMLQICWPTWATWTLLKFLGRPTAWRAGLQHEVSIGLAGGSFATQKDSLQKGHRNCDLYCHCTLW